MACENNEGSESSDLSTDVLPLAPRPLSPTVNVRDQLEQIRDEKISEIGVEELQRTRAPTQQDNQPNQHDEAPKQEQTQILQSQQQQREKQFDQRDYSIPDVPDDWAFNVFLKRLADKITTEELVELKSLFRGKNCLGEKVLEKISNPGELFKVLKQRTYLRNENLVYLQSALWHIQRTDLVEMAAEYARSIDNVVYFYSPLGQPENGYKFCKIHVDGICFNECTKDFIDDMRLKVSKLLFMPMEYVIVAGVEPSSSMLITLMIPEMYIQILVKMLTANISLTGLADMGIDAIIVEEIQYDIQTHDEKHMKTAETDQQRKFENVYKQLEDKLNQLEEREAECLELSRKLAIEENMTETFKIMFNNIKCDENATNKPVALACQTEMVNFNESLKKVATCGYDKKLIKRLLIANSNVIAKRAREQRNIEVEKLKLIVKDLTSKLGPMAMELKTYKALEDFESGRFKMEQSFVMDHMEKFLQDIHVSSETEKNVTSGFIEILKEISKELTDDERQKLTEKYQWESEDIHSPKGC